MDRLTGITPNAIGRNTCRGCPIPDGITDEDVEHALELLIAEEQGLLVRLPCKVGDTIYRTYEGDIFDWTIDSIVVFQAETFLIDDSDNYISPDDIGKTVFLTSEEAEAAMKARAEQ